MSAVIEQGTGQLVFGGTWEVGTRQPGAPTLRLDLTMAGNLQVSVTGHALLTQAINPPLKQLSRVSGDAHSIENEAGVWNIVELHGYPSVVWPPHGGIGPVLPVNLRVSLVLSSAWRDGTATFSYTTQPGGEWHTVQSVPATYTGQLPAVGG